MAIVRGDHELNETKLANAVDATDLRPMTDEEIAKIGAVPGYGSPLGVTGATVVIDDLVAASANLVAGANEEGYHFLNSNHGRDYGADVVADITAARDGDPCVVCGSPLRTTRGVEAGNIFKLGTRYSPDAVGATFLGSDGQQHPIVMGCYGIGVDGCSRARPRSTATAAGCDCRSQSRPRRFTCAVWALPGAPASEIADRLYAELQARGVEVLYDDRGERPGVQFADADLIGLAAAGNGGRKISRPRAGSR